MHIDFGPEIGADDARQRVKSRKKVGRKHNHQARGRAREKQRTTPLRRMKLKVETRRKFKAKVAAYWRGSLSEYPRTVNSGDGTK